MHSDELAGLLSAIPGTEVTVTADRLTVRVPKIGDAVRLDLADLLSVAEAEVPTGAPAVELGVRRGRAELPVIVTADDIVFTPAYAADVVKPGVGVTVPAMPTFVAYSEMHRDVRALGAAVDDPRVRLDDELLAATLLLHRCFLAGAMRVGMWPVRVAAWWEYLWARRGSRLTLPPFAADPAWDQLMAAVTEARTMSP